MRISAAPVAVLVIKSRLLRPHLDCENCDFCVFKASNWSHGVVLTGAVLVLHWFCLHPDRPALRGRAGASSGVLLRGDFTLRQYD